MKLGYFATGATNRLDFEDFARWGAEHGFRAMDVPPDRPGTREICDRHGLEVACTSGMLGNPLRANDAEREEQITLIKQGIDLAAQQGVPMVSVGSRRDTTVSAADNVRLFQLAYEPLAAYAESKGVRLVFENWPNGGRNLMITPELWDAAFNAVPSSALGLVFDPSHLVWQHIDYLRALRDFGDRVYHAHAKDTEFLPEGEYRSGIYGPQLKGAGEFWRYRLPGFGVVDWARYIDGLYRVGFDGVISIEHEDELWGAWNDPDRAKRGLLLAQKILDPFLV